MINMVSGVFYIGLFLFIRYVYYIGYERKSCVLSFGIAVIKQLYKDNTYFSCLVIKAGITGYWDLSEAEVALTKIYSIVVVQVEEAATNNRFPIDEVSVIVRVW